jgi:hypothetical protein
MKRHVGLCIFLCLILFQLSSQEPSTIDNNNSKPWSLVAGLGMTWQGQSYSTIWDGIGPSPNGIETNPLYLQFNIAAHYYTTTTEHFDFGLDFHIDEYVFRSDLGRAFPTQIETGAETGPIATVLALIPRASYTWDIAISKDIFLGISTGLSLVFRIPISALDNSTGIEAIGTYLNRSLKFLYPEFGLNLRFPLSESLQFGPWLRTLVPVHNLWNGENLPFWDNWIVNLGLYIEIQL